MAKQSKSSWDTTSGLWEGGFGKIESAKFDTDVEFADGEIAFLELVVLTDDEDHPEQKIRYSCGKSGGWDVVKKGAAVESSAGKKQFNKNSKLGIFINAVVAAAKAANKLSEMQKRGETYEAATFDGLAFEWGIIEVNYGGEIGTQEVTVPVKWVDSKKKTTAAAAKSKAAEDAEDEETEEEEETKPAKKAAASTAKGVVGGKKKPAAKEEDEEEESDGDEEAVDPKLLKALKNLAKKADSHDEFVVKAYELDGVDGVDAVMALVDKEDSGIWAEVRGDD